MSKSVVLVSIFSETDVARYEVVDGKVEMTLAPGCAPGQAEVAKVYMDGVYDHGRDQTVNPDQGQAFLDALMTQRGGNYLGFQESSPLVDGSGEVRTTHIGSYVKLNQNK